MPIIDEMKTQIGKIKELGEGTGDFKKMPKAILAAYWDRVNDFLEDIDLALQKQQLTPEARGELQGIRKEAQLLEQRAKKEINDRWWFLWDTRPSVFITSTMMTVAVAKERAKPIITHKKPDDMSRKELIAYLSEIKGFLDDLTGSPSQVTEDSDIKAIKLAAERLKIRTEEEINKRWWVVGTKPKLGRPQDEKVAEPTPTEKEKYKRALAEVREERAEKIRRRFDANESSSKSRGILASAIDEFRNALTPPLLAVDVEELQRKRDALDAAKAARKIDEADETIIGTVRGTIHQTKRFAEGAAKVLAEAAEETTGGILKAVAVAVGWPLILPIKLINQACAAAKYACCAADGILGFFDKGLDGLIGNMHRDEAGVLKFDSARNIAENIAKGLGHVLVRGPIVLGRGLAQIASIGSRWLERTIDADRWMKHTPVTAGFAIGSIAAVAIITLTVASIFTLGIPIAAVAVGLAAATVGALVHGYFKGKAKAKELSSLELAPADTTKLDKYEHDHPSVRPTVTPIHPGMDATVAEHGHEGAKKSMSSEMPTVAVKQAEVVVSREQHDDGHDSTIPPVRYEERERHTITHGIEASQLRERRKSTSDLPVGDKHDDHLKLD